MTQQQLVGALISRIKDRGGAVEEEVVVNFVSEVDKFVSFDAFDDAMIEAAVDSYFTLLQDADGFTP